jgi:phosphotriesterase-related protein
MRRKTIQTVLGPIGVDELGRTLIHEHIFSDCSALLGDEKVPGIRNLKVSPETRPLIAKYSNLNADNVVLDDEDSARNELLAFREAGGSAIVDVTSSGLGPQPAAVQRLSRETGVHIIHGCGRYTEAVQSEIPETWDPGLAAEEICREVREGLERDIPRGIIGEIGINGELNGTHERVGPITPWELASLHGACRASIETTLPITVHLPADPAALPVVVEVIESERLDPARVSLSHMDNIHDFDLHVLAIERGLYIQYDHFGMSLEDEWYSDIGDDRRIDWLCKLAERGLSKKVMISHDVWCKLQTRVGGGLGYTHIIERVLPVLRDRGFTEADLDGLLVENPATFLGGTTLS